MRLLSGLLLLLFAATVIVISSAQNTIPGFAARAAIAPVPGTCIRAKTSDEFDVVSCATPLTTVVVAASPSLETMPCGDSEMGWLLGHWDRSVFNPGTSESDLPGLLISGLRTEFGQLSPSKWKGQLCMVQVTVI